MIDDDDAPEADDDALRRRYRIRRLAVLAIGGLLVLIALAAAAGLRDDGRAPQPDPSFAIHAWAPYWVLDVSGPELTADVAGGPAEAIDELSPFWYSTIGARTIITDPNVPAELAERFLDAARDSDARLVPSITDGLPAGGMAAILADPVERRGHVDALRAFAEEGDFDGLDLDYEQFAFADARSTWATTRPNWIAFLTELADALHDDGRTLTVSIPPVYDEGTTDASGYWVYDYAAMTPIVDHIRVMAYDYSTSQAGPISPVDWVAEAIAGTAAASGDPGKLLLGLPQYGYNWPVSTAGTCPPDQVQSRTFLTTRGLDELLALRPSTPVFDELTGEWSFAYSLPLTDGTSSCTQQRQVHYVALDGALARARLAKDAGFGGISLWALGYEDPALWASLVPLTADPPVAG